MTHSDPDVKAPECGEEEPCRRGPFRYCLAWIDSHPRTGWYLVIIATANLVLNFLDLFH